MRKFVMLGVLAGAVLALGACSARTQLAMEEKKKGGAHFATWSHMGYSVNLGTAESTTKRDVELSKADQCLPNQIVLVVGRAGDGAADSVSG